MRGATLFSGIGAPECSTSWIEWRWSAEIDPFASAVHAARFPGTPNLGDVNRIDLDATEPVDLVVFGSPCQSFSVAGKRLGLDDPRGNLALVALRLIGRIRPKWVVFENVPGLLSSDGGRDFGAFLGLLGECGYGFAYRILDAQYAGVPQRRRRVFVVGCLGDWRGPAAVLFEPESLRGDTPPRREAGKDAAGGAGDGSAFSVRPTSHDASWRGDGADNLIGFHPTLRQPEFGNYENCSPTLRHEASAIAFSAKDHGGDAGETAPTLRAGQHHKSHANAGVMPAVAYGGNRQSGPLDVATAVNPHGGPHGRLDFESETFITHLTGEHASDVAHPILAEPLGASASLRTVPQRQSSALEITHSLRADGFDTSEDGTGRGTPIIPLQCNGNNVGTDLPSLRAGNGHLTGGGPAVAFHENQRAETTLNDTAGSLKVGGGKPGQGYPAVLAYGISSDAIDRSGEGDGSAAERAGLGVVFDGSPAIRSRPNNSVAAGMSVRRLTPRECERLQGFPDDFTAISYRGKPAADGPRYRALGNSMAVPVIGWVLGRIHQFEGGV